MGILAQKTKMSDVENKVTVTAFCRRRLAIVMTRLKMCENVPAVCCTVAVVAAAAAAAVCVCVCVFRVAFQ